MREKHAHVNYSIYAHSDSLFNDFNNISDKYYIYLPTYNIQLHSKKDQLISHFNYWVQLIDCNEMRVPKIEQILFHSLSIELHKFTKNHYFVQLFKHSYNTLQELYILSYFISKEILMLIDKSINPQQVNQIATYLGRDSFYELTNAELEQEDYNIFSSFHKDIFMKFTSDCIFKKQLNNAIRISIQHTLKFLNTSAQLEGVTIKASE